MKYTRKVQRKVCPDLRECRGRGIFIICKGILSSYKLGLLVFLVVNAFGKEKIMTLNNVNVAQTSVNTLSIKMGQSNIYLVKNNDASWMVFRSKSASVKHTVKLVW